MQVRGDSEEAIKVRRGERQKCREPGLGQGWEHSPASMHQEDTLISRVRMCDSPSRDRPLPPYTLDLYSPTAEQVLHRGGGASCRRHLWDGVSGKARPPFSLSISIALPIHTKASRFVCFRFVVWGRGAGEATQTHRQPYRYNEQRYKYGYEAACMSARVRA